MAQCHLDHIVIAINDPRALNVYHAICGGETVVHTSRDGTAAISACPRGHKERAHPTLASGLRTF